MSESLQTRRLQHTRLPCPPLSPTGVLLKFMSAKQVMLSNHVILCRCLLLPSIFPSIRVFSKELQSVHKMKAPISLFQCHSSVAFPGRATFKATPDKYVCWKRTTCTHTHTHTHTGNHHGSLFHNFAGIPHVEEKTPTSCISSANTSCSSACSYLKAELHQAAGAHQSRDLSHSGRCSLFASEKLQG